MTGGGEFEPLLMLFGLGALVGIVSLFRAFPGLFYFLISTAVMGGVIMVGRRWFDMPPELFVLLAVIVFCVVLLILRLLLYIHEGPGKD